MGMTDDLNAEVNKIIKEQWTTTDGRVVPETENIELGNRGVNLDATCLYADLAESTNLVNAYKATFAADVYKCYLNCACRIIRSQEGVITAFDGDRVMAVFIGDTKNTVAVRAALAINHAVTEIINPALKAYYKENLKDFQVRHSVGIDTSKVMAARTGIRGANDLVWVGRSANYAAKLCNLREGNYATWITGDVYDKMADKVKMTTDGTKNMWEERSWTAQNGLRVFRSSYYWGL
ncbi:MAG: adenylate/guanylate cyclase domain-containing protein [Phycisphaeraceae bacterium]|nr:adenylate/guanylate cyclase domain-containing protein [Phycisphaeraceae bacterium]